jgi:hypothetical protein
MKTKIAIPLMICLIAATACWPFGSNDIAEMSVKRTSDNGKVEITRGDETITVSDAEEVKVGDLVSTSGGARALLRLAGEKDSARYLNIGPDTDVEIQSEKAVEGPLHTGSIVADTAAPMRVTFGSFNATSSDGAFRVDIGVASVRAGTYSGAVRLETPGQPRVSLPKLFEVQAAASDLDAREPYRLDPGDPWDRVFLRAVVDLEEQLTPLATGLRSQLGNSRPDLPYFSVLAKQNVGFMKKYLSRPTVDLLTGFVIANNAPGSLKKNFVRAFKLFDDGAQWAVVAGILDASFKTVVAELTNVAEATGAVAGGTGGEAVFSVAAAEAVSEAGPGDSVEPPPGDGGGDDNDPIAGGDDDDDDDDTDGTQASPSPQCDLGCRAEEVTRPLRPPSPSPSGILDDVTGR